MIKFNKRKKEYLALFLLSFGILFGLVVYSSGNSQNSKNSVSNSIENKNDTSTLPKSSGVGTYNEYNLFSFSNPGFTSSSDTGGWIQQEQSGTISISGGSASFSTSPESIENSPRLVYNSTQPFINGSITIDWNTGNPNNVNFLIKCSTSSNPDWRTATQIASYSSTTEAIQTYTLDSSFGTDNSNFKIAVILQDTATYLSKTGTVHSIKLNTYEFSVQTDGNISQQDPQNISAFIFPVGTIQSGSVKLEYSHSLPISGGTYVSSSTSLNNYTFVIPASANSYGDVCYYQIMYDNSSGTNYSPTASFTATDNTPPSLSNYSQNYTRPEYYQDVAVSIQASEISGDSGLSTIFLYANNGSAASTSDFKISPETAPTAGELSGTFTFIIPSYLLTYRQTLYILIQATDVAGNTGSYTNTIRVSDNISPTFSFVSISNSTPEYNDSVNVTYNISEPNDGSGFNTDGTGLHLRYKLGSVPGSVSDYSDQVSPSVPPASRSGGDVTFTIPGNDFAYNDDHVFYFLYISDIAGNINGSDYSADRNFTIIDTFSPVVEQNSSNTAKSNYYSDKVLSFDLIEPSDASGLNMSTIHLYFNVNSSILTNNSQQAYLSYENFTTNIFNYTIGRDNYNITDTVYYLINGSDNAGNLFQATGSFTLIDLQPPDISLVESQSNDTIAENTANVKMVFNSTDIIDGVGSSQVNLLMFVKNGTAASYFGSGCIKINLNSSNAPLFTFIIPSYLLTARENLYWVVRVNDTLGNFRDYSGSFSVADDILPFIEFSSISPTINQINYNQSVTVNYTISDPLAGSGFGSSGTNLQIRYYICNGSNTPSNFNDYTGFVSSTDVLNINNGTYSVIIPESQLTYPDIVYFWGVVYNNQHKNNNTFSNLLHFDVQDQYKPVISINSISEQNSSYNDAKQIEFNAFEPTDASGLNNTTLFWGLSNPGVSTTNYSGSIENTTILPHSGTDLILTISANELAKVDASYGQKIYFIVVTADKAGNVGISTTEYFTITDNVAPMLTQSPSNTNGIMRNAGKIFSVNVWDPDYPRSSGISSITLYYLLNSSNVDTSHYTAILTTSHPVQPGDENYTLLLENLISNSWGNSTEFYYFIRVTDNNGNVYNSPVKSFIVVTIVTPEYYLPVPTSELYYYDTPYINISLSVNIPCDLWYQLDNNSPSKPIFGMKLNAMLDITQQGPHNITVYYFNNQYHKTYQIYIDLTPTSPVSDLKIEESGSVVILTWKAPPQASSDHLIYYEIYKSDSPNGPFVKWGDTPVGVLTYTDSGDQPGKTYYYEVFAVDRAGNVSKSSTIVSISIPMPPWIYIIFAAIGAVAIITIVKVTSSIRNKRAVRELGKITDEEMEKFSISDEDLEEKRKNLSSNQGNYADEDFQWQKIDWKSKAQTVNRYATPTTKVDKNYWSNNSKTLIEKALKYEINGDIAEAIKIYKLALRSAENEHNGDFETVNFLKQKLISIYSNPISK